MTFHDPLPDTFPSATTSNDASLTIYTASARPVDDELRAAGYVVTWRPHQLPDGRVVNAFTATPWRGRRPAKVMIGRLPYGNQEAPDVGDWLANALLQLHADDRVAEYRVVRIDDTPTSMCRNRLARIALEWGADALVFIDADMRPDYLVGHPDEPQARPFLKAALDFWWSHPGPCLVGAPYCCGGNSEEPLVFRWDAARTPLEEGHVKLQRYSREDCLSQRGISRVSCLPTGLLLVDTAALRQMALPWFYYEYTDAAYSEKASTEDVVFTRDAALSGIPLYCAWDSWAGHWKRKLVGRPQLTPAGSVPPLFRNACLRSLAAQLNATADSPHPPPATTVHAAV